MNTGRRDFHMEDSVNERRLMQSRMIIRVGIIGFIILLALIYTIGLATVKSGLSMRQANALDYLNRMKSHIEQTPVILERMLAFDCGTDAEAAVESLDGVIESLGENPTLDQLEAAWDSVDDAYTGITAGCVGHLGEEGFISLTTEYEGFRNRFSVEGQHYSEAAAEYNAALETFPATIFKTGFEPL